MKTKNDVLKTMKKELHSRKSEFLDEIVESVYFGGGTPSVLNVNEIQELLDCIKENYTLSSFVEITLECNPDDLNKQKLTHFKMSGINRLSIGIQSFVDEHLVFMNRAHSANEALSCVSQAKEIGFNNITIDLIYGIPGMSLEIWKQNINQAIDLNVQHISAYCLTVEKGTALDHFVRKGKVVPSTSDEESEQFDLLTSQLAKAGFDAYEVSNFAKRNFLSLHNTSYWKGKKYIGIGPSAHSFDGIKRRWNVSNNVKYATAGNEDQFDFEEETLSSKDQLNEYLMTGLRTIWV